MPWGPGGSLEFTFPPASILAGEIEVVSPDLSDPVADYLACTRTGLGVASVFGQARRAGRAGYIGRDRGRRSVTLDAGSRGAADHSASTRMRRVCGPRTVTISVGVGRHHRG